MILTKDNYFSPEANCEYMSVSQFKRFRECSASALAELNGDYVPTMSKAFLEGGYVDAHFAGSMDEYLTEHPEILNSRTGVLKAEFTKARAAIQTVEHDKNFMSYLSGARQTVLTGDLFGMMWKAKPDFINGKIVDLKYMRDIRPIWKNGEMVTFIDAYGYDIQGYVYQQLCYQLTGLLKPFYLAVITKEDPADHYVIHIPQWKLNACSEVVKYYAPRFHAMKTGEMLPERCESCAYCRSTKVIERALEYEDLLNM